MDGATPGGAGNEADVGSGDDCGIVSGDLAASGSAQSPA
jgi:hypothetical protein